MKKVKMNEAAYERLKSRLVNEISYGTVERAANKSYDLFHDISDSFEDFVSCVDEAIFKNSQNGGGKENPYLFKIKELSKQIEEIIDAKVGQTDRFYRDFDKVSHAKYYDDNEDGDINDEELMYLQDKYGI